MTNQELTAEYFGMEYKEAFKQVYEELEDLVTSKHWAEEGVETEAGLEILTLHYF